MNFKKFGIAIFTPNMNKDQNTHVHIAHICFDFLQKANLSGSGTGFYFSEKSPQAIAQPPLPPVFVPTTVSYGKRICVFVQTSIPVTTDGTCDPL
eukprot:gene1457-4616_t